MGKTVRSTFKERKAELLQRYPTEEKRKKAYEDKCRRKRVIQWKMKECKTQLEFTQLRAYRNILQREISMLALMSW